MVAWSRAKRQSCELLANDILSSIFEYINTLNTAKLCKVLRILKSEIISGVFHRKNIFQSRFQCYSLIVGESEIICFDFEALVHFTEEVKGSIFC